MLQGGEMANSERWALILGASSGFGAACTRALADAGFNIFGVHFDLKSTLPRA
ncbi:MAG TPA: 3-oxoacyl-ACP reductase, partial [Anaerolineae bacterium]